MTVVDGFGAIEVLLFDVFGTVVDWRGSLIRQLDDVADRHRLDIEPAELADSWRARYGPDIDAVLAGEIPYINLDGLHRRSLRELLGERGLDPPDEGVEEMVRCWHRLDPWPDAVEGLRRLRARFLVATMSNGNVALLVELSRHAGLEWDAVLTPELAATYKKDLRSFEYCLSLLDRTAEQSMMVSAHPAELAAVAELGMRTALINRPWEHGLYRPAQPFPGHSPDIACEGLDDLADRLGA